jgi:hypothetical protein
MLNSCTLRIEHCPAAREKETKRSHCVEAGQAGCEWAPLQITGDSSLCPVGYLWEGCSVAISFYPCRKKQVLCRATHTHIQTHTTTIPGSVLCPHTCLWQAYRSSHGRTKGLVIAREFPENKGCIQTHSQTFLTSETLPLLCDKENKWGKGRRENLRGPSSGEGCSIQAVHRPSRPLNPCGIFWGLAQAPAPRSASEVGLNNGEFLSVIKIFHPLKLVPGN